MPQQQQPPAAAIPALGPLPDEIRAPIAAAQQAWRRAAAISANTETPEADAKAIGTYLHYVNLCRSVLCCETPGCWKRTTLDEPMCAQHTLSEGMH